MLCTIDVNTEIRNNVRCTWIECLYELSHLEYQKNLWIEAKYEGLVGDFWESICTYFNDINLEEGYRTWIEQGLISNQEFEIVREFHQNLDEYVEQTNKENLSDLEILKDSRWHAIVAKAKNVWERMKNEVSTKELEHMLAFEKNYN